MNYLRFTVLTAAVVLVCPHEQVVAQATVAQATVAQATVESGAAVSSVPDGDAYQGLELVWADEFDGDELDREKWVVINRYASEKKPHLYFRDHEDNVRVEDGKLILQAHHVDMPNPEKGKAWKESLKKDKRFTQETIPLSSGRIQTADKNKILASWKYGRIDVSAKLSPMKGTHAAIWTMGAHYFDINWPRAGEIDILEFLGRSPEVAWNVIHRGNRDGNDAAVNNNGKRPFPGKSLADGAFHTFSMQWDENEIVWFCDNEETFRFDCSTADVSYEIEGKTYGNPFQMPHFIILDLTVGGWGGEWDNADLPTKFEIDFVRVYQPIASESSR